MTTRTSAPSRRELHPSSTGANAHIAVIAVHGVADQQPGDSAADIAGLLLSLEAHRSAAGKNSGVRYSGFAAGTVHVALEPLEIGERAAAAQTSASAAAATSPPGAAPRGPGRRVRSRSAARQFTHSLSERRGY